MKQEINNIDTSCFEENDIILSRLFGKSAMVTLNIFPLMCTLLVSSWSPTTVICKNHTYLPVEGYVTVYFSSLSTDKQVLTHARTFYLPFKCCVIQITGITSLSIRKLDFVIIAHTCMLQIPEEVLLQLICSHIIMLPCWCSLLGENVFY